MSTPRNPSSAAPARSHGNGAAFLIGVPLGVALVWLLLAGPLADSQLHRYVTHPVEHAELVLFCIGMVALLVRLLRLPGERSACRRDLLPPWDGKPVPTAEAGPLLAALERLPGGLSRSWVGRRMASALEFVLRRGSAADLDDQLRSLADADAVAVDGSLGLVRFITWAIPILGFLGTVLGITEAIAGVTPEVLEQSLSTVTDGLSLAFDTTAVGLALTMIVMFVSFLVDRAEQGVLEEVEQVVERGLAHRFERHSAVADEFVAVVRRQSESLLLATEQLVQRQAEVWARVMEESERRWREAEGRQQERFAAALEEALAKTLLAHETRLAALEEAAGGRGAEWARQAAALAGAVCDAGEKQQRALLQVAERVAAQASALATLQEDGQQLARLQESLGQNLAALTAAGTFEQAVGSLTAAIHLLTARTSVVAASAPRLARPAA